MTRINQYDKARLHYDIVMLRDYMHDSEQGGLPNEITAAYFFHNLDTHVISIDFILYKPNPNVPHYVPTHCETGPLLNEMENYSNSGVTKIVKNVPTNYPCHNATSYCTIKRLENVKLMRGQFFSSYKDELDRVINECKLYLLT